jgi:hypothetical protein
MTTQTAAHRRPAAEVGTRGTEPVGAERVVVAGLVCGLGAMVAHASAGGTSPAAAALLLLPASIAVCALLVRRAGDAAALGAAAILTQLGWHAVLHAWGGDAGSGSGVGTMLLAHLTVAMATVVIVLRAERALVDLARDLWQRTRVPAPLLVPAYAASPAPAAVEDPWVRRWRRSPHAERGPPAGAAPCH